MLSEFVVLGFGGLKLLSRGAQSLRWPSHARRADLSSSICVAIASRAKVVQQMLGHKSAVMTLDLCGHLFGDRLDEVGEALDDAARAAGVYPMCTGAEIVPFLDRA